MPTPSVSERLHGLDAVRGFALLLGVLLHAAMSFLPGPQLWIVADSARSTTLSVTFFVIHMMRMTVFFLIAGFFGRMVLHRIGTKGFVVNRLRRIALPFVIGWPIVLASIILVLIAASDRTAESPPRPALSPENFPLTHLWFLYVLILLYAAVLLVRAAVSFLPAIDRVKEWMDSALRVALGPWSTFVVALPVAGALYMHPYWMMWFGIPTPDMSLYPHRASIIAYGLAFVLGWLVQRQAAAILPRWERQWPWQLAVALCATVACLAMAGLEPLLMPVPQGTRKLLFAAVYAVGIWSWTFAAIGAGLRFLNGYSPVRRYLADASYWIYLVHLPLIMALQLAVSRWALPWPVKLLAILVVAMTLMLLSYHFLVRRTFVGATLNGRRYPRAIAPFPSSGTTYMRTLLLLFGLTLPLLAAPTAVVAQAPQAPDALPLDTVLARHAAAVGPVSSMQTRRTTMRITGVAPFEIPVVIEAMRPNLIRKEVTIQGSVQVTGYDGNDAWRIDPFVPGGHRPMDLPAAELGDLLEEADFDGPLFAAASRGHRVEYAGPAVVTVGSRQLPVHSLKVTLKEGRESVIHLDAGSWLEVLRVQTRPVMGTNVRMEIVSSDYRAVGGIQIPHSVVIHPQGAPTPVRVMIDGVEMNVRLDRGRFRR